MVLDRRIRHCTSELGHSPVTGVSNDTGLSSDYDAVNALLTHRHSSRSSFDIFRQSHGAMIL